MHYQKDRFLLMNTSGSSRVSGTNWQPWASLCQTSTKFLKSQKGLERNTEILNLLCYQSLHTQLLINLFCLYRTMNNFFLWKKNKNLIIIKRSSVKEIKEEGNVEEEDLEEEEVSLKIDHIIRINLKTSQLPIFITSKAQLQQQLESATTRTIQQRKSQGCLSNLWQD